jgi:hypothetical protein
MPSPTKPAISVMVLLPEKREKLSGHLLQPIARASVSQHFAPIHEMLNLKPPPS